MERRGQDGMMPANIDLSGLADVGVRQLVSLIDVQSKIMQRIPEANADWLRRLGGEAALTSRLAVKLAQSSSPGHLQLAWTEWATRRVKLMVEDAERLTNYARKALADGAESLTGWSMPAEASSD